MSKLKEVIDLHPQRRNNHFGNTRPEALDRIILPFASLVIAGTFGSAILNYIQGQPSQEIASEKIIAQSSDCHFTISEPVTYYSHPSKQPETAIGYLDPNKYDCRDLVKPSRPGETRWLSLADRKTDKISGYVAENDVKAHNIG